MPIRIWNTPGGPVNYGHELGNYNIGRDEEEIERLRRLGIDPQRMAEESAARAGVPQTPSGRYVFPSDEGAVLDMKQPGNRSAFDRIMSRRSGGEALRGIDVDSIESDPLLRESTRLATPWRGEETMELEPSLASRLGARWSGGASPKPVTISYESEALPTKGELEQSAELWKASQRPLASRLGEANIEMTLAEASKERGLASSYEADAAKKRLPSTPAAPSFQEFAIRVLPSLKGYSLDEDQLLNLLRTLYEQQYGAAAETPRRAPFGPGGAGGDETGFEGELDRRYGG